MLEIEEIGELLGLRNHITSDIGYQEAKRNRALRAACWWSKVIGLHYTIICRATETTTDYVEVLKEVRGVEM